MLKRYEGNPILKPIKGHQWESELVYNPAAIYQGGRIHLLYNGRNRDGKSRLGYASTSDGFHIDKRLNRPIFVPQEKDFERQAVEDPRLTFLEGKIYITYDAKLVDKGICRPAISSIDQEDFINKKWNWSEHRLLFPDHNESNRNITLFPEKIKGRYVIYHRPAFYQDIGSIWVAYSYDLRNWTGHKKIADPRPGLWDDAKIGAGAPPIKLKEGWLFIYHGVYLKDWSYRLGLMLIDLNDPEKILYRSEKPILEPEKDYEIYGSVPNVVFSSGAVLLQDQLFVYYGASDNVIAVATAKLSDLLPTIYQRK